MIRTEKVLSVSWVDHHRRSAELAGALGVEPTFVRSNARFLPVRYFRQWIATWRLLATDADAVLVMQPPVLSLACAYLHTNRRTTLIGDLHTGTFRDPRWKWAAPLVLAMLRKRGFAVVPNEALAELCRSSDVPVVVSHGYLTEFDFAKVSEAPTMVRDGLSFVLVPLAFAYDEPIDEILEAARITPQLTWVLTGKAPQSVAASAPKNLILTGFVSKEEYSGLRANASVVLAATTAEDTMQSAGYEALAAGTPLVTTPTKVLREYFGDAALYAAPKADSIAEQVSHAFMNLPYLANRMEGLRKMRIAEQDEAIAQIKSRIRE
ncbi:glycosyl transferase group 1 [Pseudarthrobacter chlorophenolicus A6]|uniref:Glycosyl transferase group 1 n=2 Tax=Pseudarthrobacter chlorophenolicus TaxID=85085 RepID=B8HEG3_PSECP|nr:glycosyltransferase [Pseudarthrobacter chlorophenolicus]ACL40908.1 glycosyl transferase group 1 [Pseudarthrobacter chlorophenolicus A6]